MCFSVFSKVCEAVLFVVQGCYFHGSVLDQSVRYLVLGGKFIEPHNWFFYQLDDHVIGDIFLWHNYPHFTYMLLKDPHIPLCLWNIISLHGGFKFHSCYTLSCEL